MLANTGSTTDILWLYICLPLALSTRCFIQSVELGARVLFSNIKETCLPWPLRVFAESGFLMHRFLIVQARHFVSRPSKNNL